MRVAAVVEQAWDPASIELLPAGGVDWSRAVPAPVPGSLEALELGLGLGETTVFGLGPPSVEDLLRTCRALGAAAIARAPDPLAVAAALRREPADLVLAPHRSTDHGAGVVGPALAGLLDLPQATAVEALRVEGGEAVVVRRLDRGEREELAVPLPAVLAIEPGIVTPRAATPAALLASRQAPVPTLAPEAASGPGARLRGQTPPRPAPPRLAAPDPSQPAEARIAAIVGTSSTTARRELVAGSAEEVARRIAEFLAERGFV
jgi:electron transfer flavoprotein beta subunit